MVESLALEATQVQSGETQKGKPALSIKILSTVRE